MNEELARQEKLLKSEPPMTYYFTVAFTAIGTAVVFFVLYAMAEKVNLFLIILSMSSGGIPIGFIGAFIDYKISGYKHEKRII